MVCECVNLGLSRSASGTRTYIERGDFSQVQRIDVTPLHIFVLVVAVMKELLTPKTCPDPFVWRPVKPKRFKLYSLAILGVFSLRAIETSGISRLHDQHSING